MYLAEGRTMLRNACRLCRQMGNIKYYLDAGRLV